MGRDVRVEATVTQDDGKPLAGCLLLPYVNQRRWGSHETTDTNGHAEFLLPLPNPGPAHVQVLMRSAQAQPASYWIWAGGAPTDGQTVFLARPFALDAPAKGATLYVAVDDRCEVFLNADKLGDVSGWHKPVVFTDIAGKLKLGPNILAVRAANGTGPAGLLARLEIDTEKGRLIYETDGQWKGWTQEPPGWPMPSADGPPAAVIGRMDRTLWSGTVEGWPGVLDQRDLMTRRLLPTPFPKDSAISNKVQIEVFQRAIPPHKPSDRFIGIQWEPWFMPLNAYWQTAQAVPVVGFYDSYNRDVLRQHILWFADLGIDFIMPDWSNHIWGKQHWNERPESTNEIIHATALLLETLADMKTEGIPVPKVVLMPGISNGPPAAMTAVNEELEWVYDAWVKNPRFSGLWQDFDGKPLIVILDCGVVAPKDPVPVDDTHWTVRWMSTQLQRTHHEKLGYWSWMDGSLQPVVTYRDGRPEVVTPTPAYFGDGGWLYPEARGRRGGTTYIESFKPALDIHPRVVLLHQWNEFTGQSEGQGYGDKHDVYVDTYSVELSDDLEPVSLTAPGYRGDTGGWGFYFLNLTQALLTIYRGDAPEDSVLAVGSPMRNQQVKGDSLTVDWAVAGPSPKDFAVLIDGRPVAERVQGNSSAINIKDLAPGPHTLSVVANDAKTRFPLSYTGFDVPLEKPITPRCDVPFTKVAQ